MEKLLRILIAIILTFSLEGCKRGENVISRSVSDNSFDYAEGEKLAGQYIDFLSQGDFESLARISSKDLNEKNRELVRKGNPIISYKKRDSRETGKSILYTYRVNKCSTNAPKGSLDNYSIEIQKNVKGGYEVARAEASTELEVFTRDSSLRIKYKDDVRSYLLMRTSNFPGEIYPKVNKAPIFKESIDPKEFGIISISYEGKKVAVTGVDGTKTILAIIEIDEEEKKKSLGESNAGAGTAASTSTSTATGTAGIIENPIGKKIVSLDIYSGKRVESMIFGKDEENIIVQYSEDNDRKGINIYKVNTGDLADVKLEDNFPKDKYQLIIKGIDEYSLYFTVKPLAGAQNIRQDVAGEYSVNLKDLKITKM
ncbi:MAG: hypothetical protein ABRQ27_02405 [Clostridiaceae bacterium]